MSALKAAGRAGFVRVLALLLAAPALPVFGTPDVSDGALAARRLRQRGKPPASREAGGPSSLEKLGDTTALAQRDDGHIVVMEHDGADYSRDLPDGTPNYEPRTAIARRFYEAHGDHYDFLVIFTNFEFATGSAQAFHNQVRNDVSGIGRRPLDVGDWFGSPGRLKAYIDMAALDRYGRPPWSLTPGDPGFFWTLSTLAHEVGHQWLSFVRYQGGPGTPDDLLGVDGVHWSYLLDSDASHLYGSEWQPEPGGRWRATRIRDAFSPLDLYLMGMLPSEKVTPFTLLRNPVVEPRQLPRENDVVDAEPESVDLDQVIAIEGPRQPGHLAAQKEFRLAFVYLTAPGTEANAEELAILETIRQAFVGFFFAQTRGVAVADTDLAEGPAPPALPAVDLDAALAWLLAAQRPDGSWSDTAETGARDTAAALVALAAAGQGGIPIQSGRLWLQAARTSGVDFTARRVLGLASGPLSSSERASLAGALLATRGLDGGFGPARGYASDALDTALALRALRALEHPADATVLAALETLATERHPSGGWPLAPGGDVSTVATAEVLLALFDWPETPAAQALIPGGLLALEARRNADGGFGESPSTPYGTALALAALARAGTPEAGLAGPLGWLQSHQQEDGSWGGSRYDTALVLGALRGGIQPNLAVPQDTLVLSPPRAEEGETVRVSFTVRNAGRGLAGPSRVRLFDGPPDLGQLVAEQGVGALVPGDEAGFTLDFPTADRAGPRTLYVVADALGEVVESREDDNAASRALFVEGALPDLEVSPGAIAVRPYPPAAGETVEVIVTVTNRGEKASKASLVRLVQGDPRSGGLVVGDAPLAPLDPGATLPVAFSWDTTGLLGTTTLSAIADPGFLLAESDEANNEAALAVEVVPEAPATPDLEVVSVEPVPATFTRIPQTITVRALVRNRGRADASATIALYDADPPVDPPAVEVPVGLGPRSSTTVSFDYTVAGPGRKRLVVVADPRDELDEDDEGNNEARAILVDSESTSDLEVPSGEVTVTPEELTVGEVLTVTAAVHNRGTTAVSAVPVALLHDGPGGEVELSRALVSLPPGGSTVVDLPWTAGIAGDPLPLLVRADPFGVLPEVDETNNDAPVLVTVRPSTLTDLETDGSLLTIDPDPPFEGASAVLALRVRNPSLVDALPFAVEFWRGDPDTGGTLIGTAEVPGLAAGAATEAQVDWPSVDLRGTVGLFAVVDPGNAVPEYDEENNEAFLPVSAIGYADLVTTAGDLVLEPAFPRAGQPVDVTTAVRNFGARPAPPSLLRATVGEPGSTVAEVEVPALGPGESATLHFVWTPAAAGEPLLAVRADAGEAVTESDEGNNLARRTVVVQDAELYLSAPYFSPDGDGTRDDTTIAWRAGGEVRVVVSDSRGKKVRTLAEGAPAEGQATWDGRSDEGRVLHDGVYTLTVQALAGPVLGRARATLDTNRIPIHEAAGTRRIATQNLTCALEAASGPAFMPSEEEVLLIVRASSDPDIPGGLVRVSVDGVATWLFEDPWYANASLPNPAAVSPDGREVLVNRQSSLYAVDLQSGERRLLRSGSYYYGLLSWSPDGTMIADADQLLLRDGTPAGVLPDWGGWAWSPDGRFLALGNRIVSRDLSVERTIDVPYDLSYVDHTAWLDDGRIFVTVDSGGEGSDASPSRGRPASASSDVPGPGAASFDEDCYGGCAFLLDPRTEEVRDLAWLVERARYDTPDWSPVGDRVLYPRYTPDFGSRAEVAREDGSLPLQLFRREARASPRSTLAWLWSWEGLPGSACLGSGASDLYVVRSLENLAGTFVAARLPGNNGLLLRGTASDRHLESWQLEYAPAAEPEAWRPIGPAFDFPVLNDSFGAWAPERPGTYAVRLTVRDRAGNERSRVRLVAWDRVPAIANVSQSEFLVSPNGDGVKDEVRFTYLVQEPTRLEVAIRGPMGADPAAPPPPTVRRFGVDHPDLGPRELTWDGRDESGQLVPDGRYTVELDGMPFRVDVDTTPPDIAFAWANVRTEADPKEGVGVLRAERRWHVVDANLKGWRADLVPDQPALVGEEQVFEPARDAAGEVIYDDGLPRIKRVDGRAADAVAPEPDITELGVHGGATFTATDHAGNVSVVPVVPVEERVYLLHALDYVSYLPGPDDPRGGTSRPLMLPPIAERDGSGAEVVRAFIPYTDFDLVETLRGTPTDGEQYRFETQPRAGGAWLQGPLTGAGPRVDFSALGLDFGEVYRGRFSCDAQNGRFLSESFLYRPCEDYMRLAPEAPSSKEVVFRVASASVDPLVAGTLGVFGPDGPAKDSQGRPLVNLPMTLEDGELQRVFGEGDLATPVCYAVAITRGASGREYSEDGKCRLLRWVDPKPKVVCGPPPDGGEVRVGREEGLCGDPDVLRLLVTESVIGRTLRVVGDPDGTPFPIATLYGRGTGLFPVSHRVLVDVRDFPDRDLTVLVTVDPMGDLPEIPEQRFTVHVDRTPPAGEVLAPNEGAVLCLSPGPDGRETVDFVVRAVDYAPRLALGAELRQEGGPWVPVPLVCAAAGCTEPDVVQSNVIADTRIDVTGLPGGDYTARFTFCDGAGNKSSVERRITLNREPPYVRLRGLDRGVFSPNGDLRADAVAATFELAQALSVTAQVLEEGRAGAVVKTLFAGLTFPAGLQAVAWDGRNEAGLVVPDGTYRIELVGLDPCGRSSRVGIAVEVDTTPPDAEIARPAQGAAVLGSTDVEGVAWDAHFAEWTLEVGPSGGALEPLGGRGSPVGEPGAPGRFGRWDTPEETGPYDLRLTARDLAENEKTVLATVQVVPRSRLESLAAEPDLFSPNGDGRREATEIVYALSNPGRVTLEVRAADGSLVRRLEDLADRPAGTHTHPWDGRTEGGDDVPDGVLRVHVRVEDPFDVSPPEEAEVAVEIDRLPPALDLGPPEAGAFVDREAQVRGGAQDRNMTGWTLEATPEGGATVELARGSQDQAVAPLATLSLLDEGPHVLRLAAADRAENRSESERPVVVDSIPPVVVLHDPAPASVWPKSAPIEVVGTVTDRNLRGWTLSVGPGTSPAWFTTVRTDSLGGEGIPVGPWDPAGVPDGDYTLRLEGEDEAAHREEARVAVAVDGTPPVAEIDAPAEGAYVKEPSSVTGTAADRHLEEWALEYAPGDAASAFQWGPIGSGEGDVEKGHLAEWSPLPPDGVYTLRLTVRDRVGLTAVALRTVTVDTTPPAPPRPTGRVVRKGTTTADVLVTWPPNTEPDLAGYRVLQEGDERRGLDPSTSYLDPDRPDGVYTYEVVAEDRAGNVSAPGTARVPVDLTPPLADIQIPREGARVSGSVDVLGTAWSPDDFAEYRLSVGVGASPPTFTLIQKSTLPVLAATLGTWTALGDGPHVIALEAEDTSENVARVTRNVVVDNQPPGPPVLVSVLPGAETDTLVSTWQAPPDPDLIGYLLYRGGILANADGVVLGDLRPYLLPGLTHPDPELPDGRHCYRVVAMDEAGNLSLPSNEICADLDNRPPHAEIVQPTNGLRFEFPIDVVAFTPDLDVVAVRFQMKPSASAVWEDLGPEDTQEPWQVVLDPAPLAFGEYDLRAIARDAARVDPAPSEITVVYGDTTKPAPPVDLTARVDAREVTLTWTPSPEPDVAGYRLYRDGELVDPSALIPSPTFLDTRDPGTYRYTVAAVDGDGNESDPGEPADAVVYALRLVQPFPVTLDRTATLSGSGSRADTTVEVFEEGAVVGSVSATGWSFQVPDVAVDLGGNFFTARGRDALDNRSIPSNELVLIGNEAPGPVSGLAAVPGPEEVVLSWDPAPEADVVGYAVRRDGEELTGSAPQTQAAASSTSPSYLSYYGYHVPARAFDGNPSTVWVPIYYTAPEHALRLEFPEPVLVEAVRLRFAYYWGSAAPVGAYRVEALWEGRYVPLVVADTNPFPSIQHTFPAGFSTTELRVVVRTSYYLGIAELEVTKSALATATTFTDEDGVPDGEHRWEVAAVDGLGAYGPWTGASATVDRLSRPTGLVGVPDGSDAVLTWNPNPEPDIAGYHVFRDGEAIGSAPASPAPGYRDPNLPNATYVYTVTAFDADGNESEPSDPAPVTIAVLPPQAPVLSATATELGQVQLIWEHPGAPAYALYRATVSGGPYALLVRTPGQAWLDANVTLGTTYFYVVTALDGLGNPSPTSNEASAMPERTRPPAAPVILFPTDAAHPITIDVPVTPVRGRSDPGTRVSLDVNGIARGEVDTVGRFEAQGQVLLPEEAGSFVVSPDGQRLASSRYVQATGRYELLVHELALAETVALDVGPYEYVEPVAFAPDGRRLLAHARGLPGSDYQNDLVVVDVVSGAVLPVETGPTTSWTGDWSPDGGRVAYNDESVCRLVVHDLAAGTDSLVSTDALCPSSVRWSPAGDRIAVQGWSGSRYELRLVDLAGGATSLVDDTVLSAPEWSPDGTRILYAQGYYPSRIRLTEVATGIPSDLTDGAYHAERPRFDREGRWVSYLSYEFYGLVAQALDTGGRLEMDELPSEHRWLPGSYLAVVEPGLFSVRATFPGAFEVPEVPLSIGENVMVARASDVASGLVGPDSEPVVVTLPSDAFPDLEVTEADVVTVPLVPRAGQPVFLVAHVRNRGNRTVGEVAVRVRLADSLGGVPVDRTITLPSLSPAASAPAVVTFTAGAPGTYRALVEADPANRIVESREDNNSAARLLTVQAAAALVAVVSADRTSYPARAPALVTARVLNGGPPFAGTARVAVEAAAGGEVVLLDERPLALGYGQLLEWELPWNTGTTHAGDYAFRLRLTDGAGVPLLPAEHAFAITPDIRLAARLVADAASFTAGDTAGFLGGVSSLSVNAPLAGVEARLVVRPEAGGPPVFETVQPVSQLVPNGSWQAAFAWPSAGPAGRYVAELGAVYEGEVRATATAPFVVTDALRLVGAIVAVPDHVLSGDSFEARFEVRNLGATAVSALPALVEVVSGPAATVHLSEALGLDLGPGEARSGILTFSTATLAPGPHLVRLRAGDPPSSLARASVRVHGLITPPSIHAPADGATVETLQPVLTVNNASSSEGAPLRYEFELYADAGLRNVLPGASGIAETPERTSWRVATALGEDQVYWWRARATDGFSTSGWSPVASFRYDTVNLPPTSPVPESPANEARIASRQPPLVARNASDPENDVLAYEFRLATDAGLQQVVASTTGVAEGDGLTAWPLPVLLQEDATFCWAARASDGRAFSAWSATACFLVDTENLPPSAPELIRPVDGVDVPTLTPELVFGPARDPEGAALHYLVELDTAADFSSPERQASPELPETGAETAWTPPVPLRDDTLYHWRAAATDGRVRGAWASTTFFVNLANDPPTAPVPQSPVGGAAVPSLTPELVVRNATDPDLDPLTYEFVLADLAGVVVAEVSGVAESPQETGWTTPELTEDESYQWRARASDGETSGEWSPWETFRVKAAPGAPTLVSPPEGATVDTRQPALVVGNATSPRGRTLVYTFELFSGGPSDPPVLVDRIDGVPEGTTTTSWTAGVDLADGPHSWRARAFDGQLYGPWMATARFRVAVDEPPAPPTGLTAVPGDRRVDLTWNESPEPDVVGYRLYRSLTAGGPYAPIADTPGNAHPDTGLTNGVTYHYVVTALDDRHESGYSNEAAATPQAPAGGLVAEIRFDPDVVPGECLMSQGCGRCGGDDDDDHDGDDGDDEDDDDEDDDDEDDDDDGGRRRHPRDDDAAPLGLATPGFDGGSPQCGPGGGDGQPSVKPILECVVGGDDGLLTALFGYRNESSRAVTIPIGPDNAFSPSPKDRGQPTLFAPGRTPFEEAFAVDFRGGKLSWRLGKRTATASSSSKHCSTSAPEVSCPKWIHATIELPAGHEAKDVDLESVRLAGTVEADDGWSRTSDVDGDGLKEKRVRFRFREVAPLLAPGPNVLAVTGRARGEEFTGEAVLTVSGPRVGLFVTPRTLVRSSKGKDVEAQLQVAECLDEDDIDVSSLRLNESVAVKRVVSSNKDKLIVKFDRAAVQGVLPTGDRVEVRVSGTVRGQPFVARDFIRVKE